MFCIFNVLGFVRCYTTKKKHKSLVVKRTFSLLTKMSTQGSSYLGNTIRKKNLVLEGITILKIGITHEIRLMPNFRKNLIDMLVNYYI